MILGPATNDPMDSTSWELGQLANYSRVQHPMMLVSSLLVTFYSVCCSHYIGI